MGNPSPTRLTYLSAAVVVLLLSACGGGDATSSTSAPDTSATLVDLTTTLATTSTPVAATGIVLRGDGLGVVALGASTDAAVAAVSAALGVPTVDTGWEPAFSAYGTCPGERIRGVGWDHLVLLFTDGDTSYGSGEHLFTWRVTGALPAVTTAQGLGFRSTVADAERLYPGDVEVTEPEEPFSGFVQITLEGGVLTGYLDGDVITNLEAGVQCGE
ncbi:MAG: hypothetical protein WD691_03465 [Acidimicrobiales bacterium]